MATCVLLILDSSRRMLNCTSVVQSSPFMMTILVWMVCLKEDPAILNEVYMSPYGLKCYFCVLKVVYLLKSWDQSMPGGLLALTEERKL